MTMDTVKNSNDTGKAQGSQIYRGAQYGDHRLPLRLALQPYQQRTTDNQGRLTKEGSSPSIKLP